jgi:hypothetical protein
MGDEQITCVAVDIRVVGTSDGVVFDLYLNFDGVTISDIPEALKFHTEGFLERGTRIRKIIATISGDGKCHVDADGPSDCLVNKPPQEGQ